MNKIPTITKGSDITFRTLAARIVVSVIFKTACRPRLHPCERPKLPLRNTVSTIRSTKGTARRFIQLCKSAAYLNNRIPLEREKQQADLRHAMLGRGELERRHGCRHGVPVYTTTGYDSCKRLHCLLNLILLLGGCISHFTVVVWHGPTFTSHSPRKTLLDYDIVCSTSRSPAPPPPNKEYHDFHRTACRLTGKRHRFP
jgi:hypothetical protein